MPGSNSSVSLRPGTGADLDAIASIQSASPESARWEPADYFGFDLRVAEAEGEVIGFAVARRIALDENELLNIAVSPGWRRRGIGTALLMDIRARHPGAMFLEVRDSNRAARQFYQALGFQEVGCRKEYYTHPPEAAIVMKFHS